MRSLLAGSLLLAVAALREPWDDLHWLGGGFRCAPCATQAWLRRLNATQHAMLRGELPPRFVVVRPHGRAGLGNRLRAARAGLTLAALTRRSLVLDYPADDRAELAFLRPGLVEWAGLGRLLARTPGRRRHLANNARSMDVPHHLDAPAVALVISGWNHDPSTRWRENPKLRDAVRAADLGTGADVASCGLRALFAPSPQLKTALVDARRRAFVEPVFRIAAAIHLRTNVEFEAEYLQRHKRARHCLDTTCWANVADVMIGCARGLGAAGALLVAADDTRVVEAAQRTARGFSHVGAPPATHRHHSGITRPTTQLAMERAKGVAFGHGSSLGPLVDLLLLASSRIFVGTAGSSFSEQALAWGGLDRPAHLFVTPFAKSFIGHSVGGEGAASALPPSAEAAYALCRGDGAVVGSTPSPLEAASTPSSLASTPLPHATPSSLISRNKKVTASVRGNLGEASVVTNGKRDDWLNDRWQAAKNMQGAPIPGPHWLLVDLAQTCVVERISIEFETAYARDYTLKGRTRDGGWVTLAVGFSAVESRPAKQHVLHRLASQAQAPVDQVRLEIAQPGTRWGTSVWALDVFGTCAAPPPIAALPPIPPPAEDEFAPQKALMADFLAGRVTVVEGEEPARAPRRRRRRRRAPNL